MSQKVDALTGCNNISALIQLRKDCSSKSVKRVEVEKSKNVIFNDNVTVIIGDYNIYYRVEIIWDDVISDDEYHGLGLFGYYSTDYCFMKYEKGVLIIDTQEDIIIRIYS